MILLTDRCTEYAKTIVNGDIVAGHLQILACKRHLKDLERQNTAEFNYHYDVEKSNRIINFLETLKLAEGSGDRKLHLAEFQCFLVGSLFGWLNEDGFRRFRNSYIEMARQQGKSLINGGCATYIGNFSGYNYGQLYFAATKQDQAKIVFKEIVKFCEADDNLAELFEIKDYKSEIICKLTNSVMKALSKDTKKIDGFRPLFASVDEYHAHDDDQMYKLLEGGTGNLDETLISIITTAGFNLNSPCKSEHDYCENILMGAVKDETYFTCIFNMDKEDDIWDSKNWIKANPLSCRTEKGIKRLESIAQKAKEKGGSDLRDFLTKRLNTWVQQTDNQFIDVEAFIECGCDDTLEEFRGRECTVGLDLSSGGDLTTLSLEFDISDDEYYIYSHSFMPRGRLAEHIKTDKAHYDIWEKEKLITVTGGMADFKNDYKFIIKHLAELRDTYDLKFKGIAIDPHNADGILSDLESFGCPVITITQSCKNLNDATCDVQLTVKSRKLRYDKKNSLLIWSFTNAITVPNSFGEIKVDKESNKKRIDPVDACIDARCFVLSQKGKAQIDYESEMQKYLQTMGWDK